MQKWLTVVVVVAAVLLLILMLLLASVLVEAVLVILPVTTPATGIRTRHNFKNIKCISHEDMQTTVFWISAIWNGHFCVNLRCDEN